MLALDRCAEADLDPDIVLRGFDVVCGALGTDWLNKREAISDRLTSTAAQHPLYRELKSHTVQALVLICELAEYLNAFRNDAEIATIIEDLRSAKYESSLLELATAYRWHQVAPPVRLHPPTPSGIADFEVSISGLRVVVEASTFPADLLSDPRFRLAQIVEEIAVQKLPTDQVTIFKIVVHHYPEGNFEAMLRQSVVDVCTRYVSGGRRAVDEKAENWSIALEVITPDAAPNPLDLDIADLNVYGGANDWDVMVSGGGIPMVEGELPPRKVRDRGDVTEQVRIFMRFPPVPGTPAEKIRKKLKRENEQLRGIRDARAVILDVSAIDRPAFEGYWPQISRDVLREMRKIPELTGLWLLRRGFTPGSRFGYGGKYLPNPDSIYRIPESVLLRLQQVEEKFGFRRS